MTRKDMLEEISRRFNQCRYSLEDTEIEMTIGDLLDFLGNWVDIEDDKVDEE